MPVVVPPRRPCRAGTMRPRSIRTRLSARAVASRGSWVTRTHEAPEALTWSRSNCRTMVRWVTSSAAMGSSRSRMRGPVASARARATRWDCPPDSWCGRCWAHAATPSRRSQSRATDVASEREAPRRRGPNATLARTSRCGKRRCSWKTRLHGRRSGGTRTPPAGSSRTCPSTTIRPPVRGTTPASARSSVVLPDPFGPSTATTSPSATSRWMSSWKSSRSTSTSATRLTGGWRPTTGPGGR